jgi:SagB-type dehydrogenase family enzyme
MKLIFLLITIAVAACYFGLALSSGAGAVEKPASSAKIIKLPKPVHDGSTSVEQAMANRRSVREYKDEPVSLAEVSQLLWAAQGVTSAEGLRTAPSAGALYPLEVYVVAGKVSGIGPGVYKYKPGEHVLELVSEGDKRAELGNAAPGQPSIKDAALDIVFAGLYERTTGKYSSPVRDESTGSRYPRGVGYVYMEAGHAAQNVCLQAVALKLGTLTIGAFFDDDVKSVTDMPVNERPLYILPVGRT